MKAHDAKELTNKTLDSPTMMESLSEVFGNIKEAARGGRSRVNASNLSPSQKRALQRLGYRLSCYKESTSIHWSK